eukprot:CAMPEP_0197174066 /NCGR_PEP_ID=MMETSP1423-20130617/752_1 /TAXON_ID=476441 /ORGANISM="Pseudo-nitzschia heimii, Strain UNC1101" /LENGTH=338 /DNA_ID=CAMNT_0042622959 /DNA_START=91 /DNA_END=1107 /DNA_ORIENTATION=+
MRDRSAKLVRGMATASSSSRQNLPVWTGSLSFASPESDFVSFPEEATAQSNGRTSGKTWSQTLSFASPESDFVSASKKEHMVESSTSESNEATWSKSISFASPESDFVSFSPKETDISTTVVTSQWSESLSFASPESDFASASKSEHLTTSAIYRSKVDSSITDLFEAQHLYPSPESATGFLAYSEMIDKKLLETVVQKHSLKRSLPKTMKDALNDERPIVITTTESPFCVVDVNVAWEGLCGYHREEAIGRNLGSLLQGPDTDMAAANKMVRSLKEKGFSETVITNYSKNGRQFENHIQIGMLTKDVDSDTSSSSDVYFVGVLSDISGNSSQKIGAI